MQLSVCSQFKFRYHSDTLESVDLDYPVTYLYTTLHYYERLLSDKHGLKKMLVYTILGM